MSITVRRLLKCVWCEEEITPEKARERGDGNPFASAWCSKECENKWNAAEQAAEDDGPMQEALSELVEAAENLKNSVTQEANPSALTLACCSVLKKEIKKAKEALPKGDEMPDCTCETHSDGHRRTCQHRASEPLSERLSEELFNKVHAAVGEASMCWAETPTSNFDATRASEVARKLCEAIADELEKDKGEVE